MALAERIRLEDCLRNEINCGHIETVRDLLNGTINPNSRFNHRKSPLEGAIYRNDPDMVRVILEAGADPNDQNSRGNTALLYAFSLGYPAHPEIVTLLINYCADPNIPNDDDDTPYTLLEFYREHMSDNDYRELLNILDSYEPIKEPDHY